MNNKSRDEVNLKTLEETSYNSKENMDPILTILVSTTLCL